MFGKEQKTQNRSSHCLNNFLRNIQYITKTIRGQTSTKALAFSRNALYLDRVAQLYLT